MRSEKWKARLNKMLIMVLIGTFTMAEILYLPDEYLASFHHLKLLLVSFFR